MRKVLSKPPEPEEEDNEEASKEKEQRENAVKDARKASHSLKKLLEENPAGDAAAEVKKALQQGLQRVAEAASRRRV